MFTKYQIDTEENRAFMKMMRDDLFEFGKNFPSPGGSAWYLKNDGSPWKEKNRESYCTSRMAHVYSIAYLTGVPGAKKLASEAVKALKGELKDKENGGWYTGLTAENKPMPLKLAYAHAFVILAASSAICAGIDGAEELLKEAEELFDLRYWDEEEGLVRDTWNTEFTVLDEYRGLNSNMHTVEAFLAAADVTGDEKYRIRAGRIIKRVLEWAEANEWRIPEHYTADWGVELEKNKEKPDDPFKPYGATPGHGLEWARLITQWALSTYCGEERAKADAFIGAAENLFKRAVADGWNADGAWGIVYTTDWKGNPVVHDRMHWTIAEGVNTAATLYRVTGKMQYADCYAEFLQYIDEAVLDHVNGSWFHQLDKNNRVMETVWPGKPDLYHAAQATMIPYYAADMSIAPAVKNKLEV